jgi:hypothetical protein
MESHIPPAPITSWPITSERLIAKLLWYLGWETDSALDRNKEQIIVELKKLLSSSGHQITDDQKIWDGVAESTLTIGAKAVERITNRLMALGEKSGWGRDIEFCRALAQQVHTITNQGRKLKNAVAQRKKCVKSILSVIDDLDGNPAFNDFLSAQIDNPNSNFTKWGEDLFKFFVSSGKVNIRFLDTYQGEWDSFLKEAIEYFVYSGPGPVDRNLKTKYEKYIYELISEASKSSVKWTIQPNSNSSKRDDIVSNTGIVFNMKITGGKIKFSYHFDRLPNKDLRSAALEIAVGLSKKFGIQEIEVEPTESELVVTMPLDIPEIEMQEIQGFLTSSFESWK